MALLELFVAHAELTFQEIITLSNIPKSSVYRMLMSLEELGFLEKGEDAKYRLGTIFLKYGHLVASRLDLRQTALPIMEAMHETTKEVINLIVQDGNDGIYIEKIDHYQNVRLYTALSRKSPLYAGACPRAILAFLPEEKIHTYLANVAFEPIANNTPKNVEDLKVTLKRERAQGYTTSFSELENHTAAVAAPIFDYRGIVVASISIAGIEANYTGEHLQQLIAEVVSGATKISQQLGYTGV